MVEEIETARKKALHKRLLFFLIFFVIDVFIIFFLKITTFFSILIVLSFILPTIITSKDVKIFKDLYKKNIVIVALNKICTDVEFDLDRGFPYSVISNTNMMYMGDNFYSNDYVKGKYKNVNFEMSDITIEETNTDSEGNTTTTTLFSGQWYIFDFNKEFKANMQVYSKNFNNVKRKRFARAEDCLKKVEFEDIEFNKMFKVYAQNELESFYVLTPNVIERIKEVSRNIKGKLLFCFIDNKLHVGVNSYKDLFEASLYKKINFEEAIEKTNKEISTITNFVNILSLDNDLFKN